MTTDTAGAAGSSTWRDRPVLVTGAGGFIGSHLVERLARDGARVRALVRYNSRGDLGLLASIDPSLRDAVDVHFGDLTDPWSVRRAVAGCDVVFHLGALIPIPYSYRAPAQFVETNVHGTLNVLQAVREHRVSRMVQTSTSEVYGTAQSPRIDESHRLHAQSPYAASKIGADQLALSFHLSFDLPVAVLRPFNTYGPRQSARAIIPTIIAQACQGTDIRLGALHPTRDFTFVTDTVDAFIRMADADGALGRTVNVGSGRTISVGELADTIVSLSGRPLAIRQDQTRVRPAGSEVERLVCDATLARTLLGWEPRVSLREGLQRTIDWIAGHPAHYRPQEYAV